MISISWTKIRSCAPKKKLLQISIVSGARSLKVFVRQKVKVPVPGGYLACHDTLKKVIISQKSDH